MASDQGHADPYHNLLYYDFSTIQFFRYASTMLDLPVRTTGTAMYYYHRFHHFMSKYKNAPHPRNGQSVHAALPLHTNEELLAITCLLLACKTTDMPRKVRDLVNVGYRYFHPEEPLLEADEVYFQMRTSLTTCELMLVRALDCDLEIELPFAYCLNVLRAMGAVPFYSSARPSQTLLKDVWKRMESGMPHEFNVIARLTWLFVWDSLVSPKIVLNHTTAEIGLGCLYLSLRMTKAEIHMTMSEWVDHWGVGENVSVQSVRNVAESLMELHDSSAQYLNDHRPICEKLDHSFTNSAADATSPQTLHQQE
ncbi:hypothetical protein DM01DRAFT_1335576 [Hesseltinella vesiculosa]|uniref:Cyclin N-terminal domain-containing protein n=1 Tax=Hesseltinella vesiculosa TaxID=101127 RepID=A0A1X2GI49_9FUNG|nr:hypothetical protein DM01DRAFT_1335576 [Hesseltinella vesiculosa]